MREIEEGTLFSIERLGLAYCRLNVFEWDEIVGEKPPGFDKMPDFPESSDSLDLMKRNYLTKHDFLQPAIEAIRELIGEANTSRCWWKFQKIGSEAEWFKWYCGTHGLNFDQVNRRRELLKNQSQEIPERVREQGTTQSRENSNGPFVSMLRLFLIFFFSSLLGILLFDLLQIL